MLQVAADQTGEKQVFFGKLHIEHTPSFSTSGRGRDKVRIEWDRTCREHNVCKYEKEAGVSAKPTCDSWLTQIGGDILGKTSLYRPSKS